MTKDQIWEILEIHKLLIDKDEHKKSIGVSLLVDFIERNCFNADTQEN